MADVRMLISKEGRTARNLVTFNVPVNCNGEKITKKPPSVPKIVTSPNSSSKIKNTARIRSASTGRDKKSELQARYWAFLFGNLQRAIDGIYQTCEEDENISECKEVILVLENYTRDFVNLIEWFKVKWAYENASPPLRQAPLAWEVRKTSPCRNWNALITPKSSSPLQRTVSPSCLSPVDQTIVKDKVSETQQIHETNVNSSPSAGCEEFETKFKDMKNVLTKTDTQQRKEKNTSGRKADEFPAEKPILNNHKLQGKGFSKSMTLNRINYSANNRKSSDLSNRDSKNQIMNKENKEIASDVMKRSNTNFEVERLKNKTNLALNDIQRPKSSNNYNKNSQNKFSSALVSRSRARNPSQPSLQPNDKVKTDQISTALKFTRSKTTLSVREVFSVNKVRPGSSVMVRGRVHHVRNNIEQSNDISGSVEVLTKPGRRTSADSDGWQTVRSRYRRGSSHSLNMSTRFYKPTTATSLPALSIGSSVHKRKLNTSESRTVEYNNSNENGQIDKKYSKALEEPENVKNNEKVQQDLMEKQAAEVHVDETNSTSMIAAVFKTEAELLEKRIRQFMLAQAERERIILEEERKTEEADSKRSQQLSDEEAALKQQILELESSEIDVDTETDETDGEMILEAEETDKSADVETDDISLEDRYENMLEGMSWAERVDTLEQLKVLVTRHPGRVLELHQKLSSPSRKRSLPETLRRYQAKQACAEHKRQKLLLEKSQRLRELFNKVEDVKNAKNQLTEDKRVRMEMKLKRAEENRTQHLLEIVRKAHDEESKLKEIAFINELEAQNKRHDFMALCQEQEERLQGIQEERQRRQEEKAAKEAAAEERRRALEAERQLKIQKMRQTRREREERVGKMQLEREKERQELAREKARDREERLSALHAAQLANQEELQKKIAQKQQESARRHGENIEHIRQRAVELSILRMEEIPPVLKSYPLVKQCTLCNMSIKNEVSLVSHLKSKLHLDSVKKVYDNKESSRDEVQKFNIAQIKDSLGGNITGVDEKVKEKQRALKRRSRKMRQRLISRGAESGDQLSTISNLTPVDGSLPNNGYIGYESNCRNKFKKCLKELEKLSSSHAKNSWNNIALAGLEKVLGEIGRIFKKEEKTDQTVFRSLKGIDILTTLLGFGISSQNGGNGFGNKSLLSILRVYKASVSDCLVNIETVLLSNNIIVILDLILEKFEAITSLDDQAQSQEVLTNGINANVTTAAVQLLCSLLPEKPFDKAVLNNRVHDIIGFLVTGGLIERISRLNLALIETDFYLDPEHESPMIIAAFDLLYRLCCQIKRLNNNSSDNLNTTNKNGLLNNNNNNEQTSIESLILSYLETSEAAGVIGCLYATYALANQKSSSPTPGQISSSPSSRILALKALKLLRTIGEVDLHILQKLLGADSTALQWRLLASHMINKFIREQTAETNDSLSCQNSPPAAVLILEELFTVIGYFAVNNIDNQLILQTAGSGPSVLQHLCTLPFPFYGDPKLSSFTFPTLLAATHNNTEAINILSCEMSFQLLIEYRDSEEGKSHPLIRLLKD